MVKVILDLASNGVIKTVADNNINGAGDKFEKRSVYNFENDPDFEKRIGFISELCEELGIETGNKYDKKSLIFKVEWGSNYKAEIKELNSKIKDLTSELKALKKLKDSTDDSSEKI
jgi:hypothetical protein